MAKPSAILCAYCAKPEPETRDHIPPDSFFPKPKPPNLITVPCCEKCRKEQQLDDEYFRFAVVTASRAIEQEDGRKVVEAIRRSFWKPKKAGFARLVDNSLIEAELKSPAGLYLGKQGLIRLKRERIDRPAQRIVRGLFFHERGYPLPDGYEVANTLRQGGFDEIIRGMGAAKFPAWKKVGKVFWYTFMPLVDDPNSTVWLQLYYQSAWFIGVTSKTEQERDAA